MPCWKGVIWNHQECLRPCQRVQQLILGWKSAVRSRWMDFWWYLAVSDGLSGIPQLSHGIFFSENPWMNPWILFGPIFNDFASRCCSCCTGTMWGRSLRASKMSHGATMEAVALPSVRNVEDHIIFSNPWDARINCSYMLCMSVCMSVYIYICIDIHIYIYMYV